MNTVVLLSGCGVYDGSEIHESVFALLCLSQNNLNYVCAAPDINHLHILNHQTGKEINQKRNVLVESSRVSRGGVLNVDDLNLNDVSSLVIPGGFGVAKNLSSWAFDSEKCDVLSSIKRLILHCVENKKPIVSLCISPTIIAKCLQGSSYSARLTVGSPKEASEYDIESINKSIRSLGSKTQNTGISGVCFDDKLKIISAPCYMQDAKIHEVYKNIGLAIKKLKEIL